MPNEDSPAISIAMLNSARTGGLLAFAMPLLIYLLTLPPGLTWAHDGADGGDLVAAAATLGIPHPPGYPLYTLAARLFLTVPWGTPAHRMALFSAAAGAAAAWVLFRLCLTLLGRSRWPLALAASLAWAFAPIPWGQAVIVEVYALSALLALGTLTCLIRWRQTGQAGHWRLAWLLFGLGMAHHLSIAALLVPAALWAWERRGQVGRRRWAEAAGLVFAGLCFYVYLPVRAAASPPINWGDPRTLSRWWWVVSAAPYRHFAFSLPLAEWPSRISAWAGLLVTQFKVWGVALGLWGAMTLHERDRGLSWGLLGAFALATLYAIGYNTTDSYVYLLPTLAVFAVWLAFGLDDVGRRAAAGRKRPAAWLLAGGALLLAALPLASLGMNWAASDLSGDREAQDYVEQSLAVLPPDALVLATGDRQTFALWYARWVTPDGFHGEVISLPLLQFDWYREQVQARNPGLALPSAALTQQQMAVELIGNHRGQRPVFLTYDALVGDTEFVLTPQGPLFKVQVP